jgi:alkanesulfonate monooxygenase SsuD/methylene tetrahydromethanopterin reductase-like flavin-dependent oxidoreductase (luciferase family)
VRPALGFVIRPELPPEDLAATARAVEAAGFDELWLWEDCFLAGGIAATAAALAATSEIVVGLGIMPAPVRNPAFAAMEIAALERLHPGRVHAGFGHGVTAWMRQVGAKPESQLASLEETLGAVRALLRGEEVRVEGRHVRLDGVRLDHPPASAPPVSAGVRRAKSLAVSGRAADGTILSEPSSVPYLEWAQEQIAPSGPHRITVYTWWSEDRGALRPLVAERLLDGGPQVEQLGIADEIAALGPRLAADMPAEWIDRVAVVGGPDECRAAIGALAAAGADAVVLVPPEPVPPPAVAAVGG